MKINVVGAVIVRDGLVLCAQRGMHKNQPGKWEFPGGKVEAGEYPEVALQREILEELGCEISVGNEIVSVEHDYDTFSIQLTTYYCAIAHGEPQAGEHEQILWLPLTELGSLDWAEADIPTVNQIIADFGQFH